MEEIYNRVIKYKDIDVERELADYDKLAKFSLLFYEDVSEIYDSITRIKNLERNPSGYNHNDAAILGLLVRMWKILKAIVNSYKEQNANTMSLLNRQLVETAVISKYLLLKGEETIEDYRKCSYKSRLQMLAEYEREPENFSKPPGRRLLKSIKEKMAAENLTVESFEAQKQNNWKLSGKSFYKIFIEVQPAEFYKYLYGIGSESIHGSWNDSLDHDLVRNEDGTLNIFPFNHKPDIRFVTPLLKLTEEPYLLWLERIDAKTEYLNNVFKWMRRLNAELYEAFELLYDKGDIV